MARAHSRMRRGSWRRRRLYGLDDGLVAGTAAEVPFETVPYLVLGGCRVVAEQRDGRHHEARRAVPTLEPVVLVEGALDGVKPAVLRKSLDRQDLGSVGLDRGHGARLHRIAVEQD